MWFSTFLEEGYGLLLAGKADKHYHQGNYGDAEVYYHRALEKDPALWQAIYNLGNVLYKQERYEEAVIYYKKALAKATPASHGNILYNLGNTYYKMNSLHQSVEYYKQVLRNKPDAMKARFNLAFVQNLLSQQKKEKTYNREKTETTEAEEPSNQQKDSGTGRDNAGKQDTAEKETFMTEAEINNVLQLLDQEERRIHQQILKKNSKQLPQKSLLNDW
jgi:tetratricopeptide (TPR) repeat protein